MKKAGNIINFTGRILGTAIEYNVKMGGEIIGAVADIGNKHKFANKSRVVSKNIGEALGNATKKTSYYIGKTVDEVSSLGVSAAKMIKDAVVKEDITEINQNGEVKKVKYVKDVKFKVIEDK